ncbi:MAG: aldo/keto reductase [Bacteroidales bacterium]
MMNSHITFTNGDRMPLFGLGTWRASRDETYNAVFEALKCGYRHIDCAAIYDNEDIIGDAIADAIAQGIVQRGDLFITSKLWNDSHLPTHVEPALRKTLHDLRLEYLDLYLIHWPVALTKGAKLPPSLTELLPIEQIPLVDTWHAMEQVKDKGLCKHIGVSNFSAKHLQSIIQLAKHKPEMNQIELHPYLQQNTLLQYCQEQEIHLTAYAPLGAGKAGGGDFQPIMQNTVILSIALRHKCSPASILIAWALSRKTVVIPKSVKSERLKENFEAQNIQLTQQDMQEIAFLDCNYRITTGVPWTPEGSPYTLDYLWQ